MLKLNGRILTPDGHRDIRAYCLGTVCLTCEWILGKFLATPEELAEVYETALPPTLRVLVTTEK